TTTNGYADGLSAPAGATRPNPRAISNAVVAQQGPMPNDRGASDFLWQWGQFIDHDLDLSSAMAPPEPFAIAVPAGDPHFDPAWTGAQWIALDRSRYAVDGA